MATEYVYKDTFVYAEDAEEAYEKAQGDIHWEVVGGDFEIHADMTFLEIGSSDEHVHQTPPDC